MHELPARTHLTRQALRYRQIRLVLPLPSLDARTFIGPAFRIGDTPCVGAPDQIREIIRPTIVTRIPGTPDWVQGLFSLRGRVVPLISLPDLLGLGGRLAKDSLLVEISAHLYAFAVHDMIGLRHAAQTRTPVPAHLAAETPMAGAFTAWQDNDGLPLHQLDFVALLDTQPFLALDRRPAQELPHGD